MQPYSLKQHFYEVKISPKIWLSSTFFSLFSKRAMNEIFYWCNQCISLNTNEIPEARVRPISNCDFLKPGMFPSLLYTLQVNLHVGMCSFLRWSSNKNFRNGNCNCIWSLILQKKSLFEIEITSCAFTFVITLMNDRTFIHGGQPPTSA